MSWRKPTCARRAHASLLVAQSFSIVWPRWHLRLHVHARTVELSTRMSRARTSPGHYGCELPDLGAGTSAAVILHRQRLAIIKHMSTKLSGIAPHDGKRCQPCLIVHLSGSHDHVSKALLPLRCATTLRRLRHRANQWTLVPVRVLHPHLTSVDSACSFVSTLPGHPRRRNHSLRLGCLLLILSS